jgi:hypothetical protein
MRGDTLEKPSLPEARLALQRALARDREERGILDQSSWLESVDLHDWRLADQPAAERASNKAALEQAERVAEIQRAQRVAFAAGVEAAVAAEKASAPTPIVNRSDVNTLSRAAAEELSKGLNKEGI